MAKTEEKETRRKQAFSALLTQRGFKVDNATTSGVPTVLCDSQDMDRLCQAVRTLAKQSGYTSSWGVRVSVQEEQSPDENPSIGDFAGFFDDDEPDGTTDSEEYTQLSLFGD